MSQKDNMAANTTLSTIIQVQSPDKEGNHPAELSTVHVTLEVFVLGWALQFIQGSFFLTVTILCSLHKVLKMHKNTKNTIKNLS